MFVISGANGHVGSVAAQKLLDEKQKIRVIVRSAEKGAAWQKKGAEVAVGGLEDEPFVRDALKGAQGFFVLIPPNMQTSDLFEWQCHMADTIAKAVKVSGIGHVVMLSSVGADQKEGTGPIKGLHYFENALRKTGTKLTAIRAGAFQENIAHVLGAATQAGIYPNFAPSADLEIPAIATKDIGGLVAHSLMHPAAKSEVVDLQGPSYSARQLAKKLGDALGKPLTIVDVPSVEHVKTLMEAGFSKALAESYAEMNAGAAKGLLVPHGERLVQGKTTIDDFIKKIASQHT